MVIWIYNWIPIRGNHLFKVCFWSEVHARDPYGKSSKRRLHRRFDGYVPLLQSRCTSVTCWEWFASFHVSIPWRIHRLTLMAEFVCFYAGFHPSRRPPREGMKRSILSHFISYLTNSAFSLLHFRRSRFTDLLRGPRRAESHHGSQVCGCVMQSQRHGEKRCRMIEIREVVLLVCVRLSVLSAWLRESGMKGPIWQAICM